MPALGSLAAEPLYVLADTAIVGRLGTAQLGGLALAATLLTLMVSAGTFLVYGTTERVARFAGRGDHVRAGHTAVQAMWLALMVSVPLSLLVGVGAGPLARVLGGDGDVLDFAVRYLRISAVGLPAVFFVLAAQGALRGLGRYRLPMIVLLSANALNVVVEVILVFGFDLGVAGSAWSTVIAQVSSALAFVVLVRRQFADVTARGPNWSAMRPLVDAGRHLLVRSGAMLVVLVGATSLASRTDEPTLAAHQVAVSLLTFLALVLDAPAIAAQNLVADQLGRDDRAAAAHIARRVVRVTLVAAAGLAVLIGVAAPILPHAFTGDGAVVSRATVALVMLALLLLPAAAAYALDGVLIGAADYRYLGRAALAMLVVLIPAGIVVAVADLGIVGIWSILALWMLLRAAVNTRRSWVILGP